MTRKTTHRPECCEVCKTRLPIGKTGRPRLTCSARCYALKRQRRAHRPTACRICNKPLKPASTGRVRLTCSDRCRQVKRRWNYQTWIEPQRWKKTMRHAEREVRKIEKMLGGPGSLDIPTPGYEWLTLRKRVLIRFQRGEDIPFCKVCWRPIINDTPRTTPTCQGRCEEVYRERKKALEEGLQTYAGKYDPRVDVRLRLGLPIKTCRQCGIPFPDYHPRRVYCGKRCANAASYARHPKRACSECGEAFRGRRKTCSQRCYRRRWRRTATLCDRCRQAIPPGREMRYEPSYNGPNPEPIRNHHGKLIPFQEAVFCSARCRDALGWSPSRKVCEECREGYYPKSKSVQRRQKYCGDKCRSRAKKRQETLRRQAAEGARLCRWCYSELPRVTNGPGRPGYCGEVCRREGTRANNRRTYQARRARVMNLTPGLRPTPLPAMHLSAHRLGERGN